MSASVSTGQLEDRSSRLVWLGAFAALLLVATQAVGIITSPPDRDMGNLEKILYVHVPAAWSALIACAVVLVASALYLWRREERYDLLAASAAEVGAVLTGLALALGSIWGRPTWGVWWTWDPRLTSTAVQMLLLVSYLALRSFVDEAERRAQWSAAVGILAGINVPIVYMSVKWWRTLHQLQSNPSSVDPQYAMGLRTNAIAMIIVLGYFIARRYRVAQLQREAENLLEEAALGRGEPLENEAAHV
jgi:heme exporter protein C